MFKWKRSFLEISQPQKKCTAYHVLSRKNVPSRYDFRTVVPDTEFRIPFSFIELISIEKALKFDLRLDFGFIICFPPTAPYIIDLQRHVCIVIMFSYVLFCMWNLLNFTCCTFESFGNSALLFVVFTTLTRGVSVTSNSIVFARILFMGIRETYTLTCANQAKRVRRTDLRSLVFQQHSANCERCALI